jgi:hypothetical protein
MIRVSIACVCMGFTLAVPTAAQAADTAGGCPPAFQPMTVAASADLLLSQGSPLTYDQLVSSLSALDRNGDRTLCVMDLPNTPGLPPYVYNFVDNRVA